MHRGSLMQKLEAKSVGRLPR
ncbi:hypothetical protein [Bradyrhizobium sp. Ec3.3]